MARWWWAAERNVDFLGGKVRLSCARCQSSQQTPARTARIPETRTTTARGRQQLIYRQQIEWKSRRKRVYLSLAARRSQNHSANPPAAAAPTSYIRPLPCNPLIGPCRVATNPRLGSAAVAARLTGDTTRHEPYNLSSSSQSTASIAVRIRRAASSISSILEHGGERPRRLFLLETRHRHV